MYYFFLVSTNHIFLDPDCAELEVHKPVDFTKLGSVFFIMASGILMAVVSLWLETVSFFLNKYK